METDKLTEAITHLKHSDHFKVFLNDVRDIREEKIRELAQPDTNSVHQIVGQILAYDYIISIFEYKK